MMFKRSKKINISYQDTSSFGEKAWWSGVWEGHKQGL